MSLLVHINLSKQGNMRGSMEPEKIIDLIFEAVSDNTVTLYRICRRTKLHPNTVKRYIGIITSVQRKEKLQVERKEFRVLITKKKSATGPAA